jgi:hypothetical protein
MVRGPRCRPRKFFVEELGHDLQVLEPEGDGSGDAAAAFSASSPPVPVASPPLRPLAGLRTKDTRPRWRGRRQIWFSSTKQCLVRAFDLTP